MLYNPKTDYQFWLQDNITQTKILKAGMASMDFICELQAEVAFYQNIIKESFLDDSNS